jgi:hypothetical protein
LAADTQKAPDCVVMYVAAVQEAEGQIPEAGPDHWFGGNEAPVLTPEVVHLLIRHGTVVRAADRVRIGRQQSVDGR